MTSDKFSKLVGRLAIVGLVLMIYYYGGKGFACILTAKDEEKEKAGWWNIYVAGSLACLAVLTRLSSLKLFLWHFLLSLFFLCFGYIISAVINLLHNNARKNGEIEHLLNEGYTDEELKEFKYFKALNELDANFPECNYMNSDLFDIPPTARDALFNNRLLSLTQKEIVTILRSKQIEYQKVDQVRSPKYPQGNRVQNGIASFKIDEMRINLEAYKHRKYLKEEREKILQSLSPDEREELEKLEEQDYETLASNAIPNENQKPTGLTENASQAFEAWKRRMQVVEEYEKDLQAMSADERETYENEDLYTMLAYYLDKRYSGDNDIPYQLTGEHFDDYYDTWKLSRYAERKELSLHGTDIRLR